MTTVDRDLLPCPFCGSHLIEAHSFATKHGKTFVHEPDIDCAGRSIRVRTDAPESIEAWNRRTAAESALSASGAPGPVPVKPLEWVEEFRQGTFVRYQAGSAIGFYEASTEFGALTGGGLKVVPPSWSSPFSNASNRVASLEAAKAAAQADYETRIRSALAHPHASSLGWLEDLYDLLTTALEHASFALEGVIALDDEDMGKDGGSNTCQQTKRTVDRALKKLVATRER